MHGTRSGRKLKQKLGIMKHRPRQFGAESFRALWCMEGKFCSRLFWMRGSETTFEHEHHTDRRSTGKPVLTLARCRPAALAPGTGTGARQATPGTGQPAQAAGTGTGTAHATPGTRTLPIPLPLVPRGRGSASCLRVQGPRVDRVGCPVSSGPSRAVSACPGAACRACPVSGVQQSIASRVHVSRGGRSTCPVSGVREPAQ